jgi:uncharacterized FlaG/YvyC family protein
MKTMCKASKIVRKLHSIENEINQALKQLGEEVSQADRELNEFYHATELHDRVNAAEGYKRYMELREILRKRRVVKDERVKIESLHHQLTSRSYGQLVNCAAKSVKKLNKKHDDYAKGWNFTYDDYKQRHLQ